MGERTKTATFANGKLQLKGINMKRFLMGLAFCIVAVAGVLAQSPLLVYVAHRGCHVNDIAPQNSVDAVYYAARAGYDYTELDVRKTRDGVFVCMHASFSGNVNNRADYSPVENASKLNVELFTYDELVANYVTISSNPALRKAVPTFEEMLWACKKFGIKPYIHCKIVGKGSYDNDPNEATSLAYKDAEHDVPVMWNMIQTILGTDDVYWGGTYSSDIRKLSERANVCVQMLMNFPPEKESWAQDMQTRWGGNLHTNNNPYGDQSDFTFRNLAVLKTHRIAAGIFETGVVPNFNWYLNTGIDLIVSDYTCPPANRRPSVFVAITDNMQTDDFVTTGAVEADAIRLQPGQSVTLQRQPTALFFGGVYCDFQLMGKAVLRMDGYSKDFRSPSALPLVGDTDNASFSFQYLIHNVAPSFTLQATSECVLKNIHFRVVPF